MEKGLVGRAVGDTVEILVAPAEGFGEYRPELTFTDALENVPEEYRYVGAQTAFQNDRGETVTVVVSRIEDGKLTIDANHPLAGQTVRFRVTVVGVRDATPQEIAAGRPHDTASPSRLH